MNTKFLAKFLIIGAVLIALFALGRGYFYFDNEEVEAGPDLTELDPAQVNGGETPEPSELPSRLIIPKLGIESDVQRLGVTRKGNMAAPDNFTDVSWYKYGTAPGFRGSAVMAGHEDNGLGTPAVFYDLHELEIGDEVIVERENGARLTFEVVDEKVYAYDDPAPLEGIFNRTDGVYLNLITCAGEWVPEAKTNDKRLVIYAKLVE